MKLGFVFLILFSGVSHGGGIVGGELVKHRSDAPFMVVVGTCGGIIVHEQWILTAAHCLKRRFIAAINSGERKFVTGTLDKDDPDAIKLEIDKAIPHPKRRTVEIKMHERYVKYLSTYDVGLIKLKRPLKFSDKVAPIKLTPRKRRLRKRLEKEGKTVTLYGWGLTGEDAEGRSRYLRKVEVQVVPHRLGRKRNSYGPRFMRKRHHIMGGVDGGGKSACAGDSGGPMVSEDPVSGESYVVGLSSWGEGCARPTKYSVFARMSSYEKWVRKTIESN